MHTISLALPALGLAGALLFAADGQAGEDSFPALPALEAFGGEDDGTMLTPIDRIYAEAAARLAAHFIAGVMADDGAFGYEFDFLRNEWSDDDNIVRQAGAIAVLSAYLDRMGRDDAVEVAIVRGLERLRTLTVPFGSGQLVSTDGRLSDAQIGSTALALDSEILYAAATGDNRFADLRADWLTALAAHWDPERGIRRTPVAPDRSSYYDGETWLAVATYVAHYPDDTSAAAFVASLDRALMAHYVENPDGAFFHWGAMAARVRFETTGNPEFVEFSVAQVEWFRGDRRPYIDHFYNTCSSVEGLAATWHILDEQPRFAEMRAVLRNRVLNEQHKNAEMQIRPGQTSFDPVDGVTVTSATLPQFAGAYFKGRHRLQTRIDTTQHCLSAWLQMLARP